MEAGSPRPKGARSTIGGHERSMRSRRILSPGVRTVQRNAVSPPAISSRTESRCPGRSDAIDVEDVIAAGGTSAASSCSASRGAFGADDKTLYLQLEAETEARQLAVTSLAAYVEKAIRSLSARIDDLKTLVGAPSAVSGDGTAPDSSEWTKELQTVRFSMDTYMEQLSGKLQVNRSQLEKAHELEATLGKLSDEVAEVKKMSEGSQCGGLPEFEPITASPTWSEGAQSKEPMYRSCVLVDPEASPKLVGSPVKRGAALQEAFSKELRVNVSEVKQIRSDLDLCQTASAEARRLLSEETQKLAARLTQLEHELKRKGDTLQPLPLPLCSPPTTPLVQHRVVSPKGSPPGNRTIGGRGPVFATAMPANCSGAGNPLMAPGIGSGQSLASLAALAWPRRDGHAN